MLNQPYHELLAKLRKTVLAEVKVLSKILPTLNEDEADYLRRVLDQQPEFAEILRTLIATAVRKHIADLHTS